MKLGIIGAGNMASAIIGGIIKKGIIAGQDIICSSPVDAERDKAAKAFGINVTADNKEVIERFIKKHGFTRDPRKLYKMIVQGLTVRPFFEIKATDDDYGDSYSLLGCDDGQNSLEQLIKLLGL